MKLKFWQLGRKNYFTEQLKGSRGPLFISISAFIVSFCIGVFFYQTFSSIKKAARNFTYREHIADCAVVLTGGPNRVREGFDLLAQSKVKKLIISGVHQDVALRDLLPMWPVYGNLNEEDVFLEKRAGTTFGNAQQSLPLVEALRCRDFLLVTSVIHMPRAYSVFRNNFPEGIDIIAHPVMGQRYVPHWTEVGLEAIKSMFYSLFFY